MYYEQSKKAIPTTYGGIKMRSILEVRWAVYFDFLGVDWIYEPAKFKIPKFKSYTPDFFLTKEKIFLEIKPESFEWDDRHEAFAKLYGYSIGVCRGMPGMSKQSYIKPTPEKIERGMLHFFSKYKDEVWYDQISLEWFYKVLWTWVKTHQIVGGGSNFRVDKFTAIEMLDTLKIMQTRGETSEMVWPVAGNQCPQCRKFDIWECDERIMERYCTWCGYNRADGIRFNNRTR